jgi:hypothetical protein
VTSSSLTDVYRCFARNGLHLNDQRVPQACRTMALRFIQPLTEMSTRKSFWGIKRGLLLSLTISPPSANRLCRKWRILRISQTYGLPWPVTGIPLLYFLLVPIPSHKNPIIHPYSLQSYYLATVGCIVPCLVVVVWQRVYMSKQK